jgi:arylsulfatase A-like enzyme
LILDRLSGAKVNRRQFLKTSLAAAATGCFSGSLPAGGGTPPRKGKPNIIFFLVDDMGWQDTSVPFHNELTDLNRTYRSPNMERLAGEGMKFTQAYACAVCSPTRVSLMIGLNAARHRVTNWTLRKNVSPDPRHKTLRMPQWNVNGLSPVPGIERTIYARTLPMFLREARYRTVHVGKAHWGAKGTPGEDPLQLGFDVNVAGHAAGGPGSYYGKYSFSAAWRGGDRIWDIPGLEQYHGRDVYLNEALTLEANKIIEKAAAEDKPFYLYMSHYAIHAPWEKDERFYDKYKKAGLSDFNAAYASMIESMDKSLGDIMANLKRLKIDSNTIIVFMSDNGAPKQAARNRPLRGHKLTAYEGGIRVPMIVKWPSVTEAGSVCNDCVIIEDIFPTLLEMAGVRHYRQIGGKIDGVSFVPLLKQQTARVKDRALFWHFPHSYDQPPYSAIRKGDFKLIYFHSDQCLELYNLRDDIGESENLAEAESDVAGSLAEQLSRFLRECGADMPTIKSTGGAVPLPAKKES